MDVLPPLDPFELPDDAPAAEGPAPPARRRRRATADRPRTSVFCIRLLPGERRAVNAAARRVGARSSSWGREVLLAAAAEEVLPSLDAAATEELLRLRRDLNAGVGNNLNQAMKAANELRKAGASPDEDALLAAVSEARQALQALRGELGRVIAPRGRR